MTRIMFSFGDKILGGIRAIQEQEQVSTLIRHRTFVHQEHGLAHQRVVDAFGATYLRKPNAENCQFLMQMHDKVHDFLRMLGSIDCMHWGWKNCPTAWRGQFTNGYKGTHPTMILEAIVDHCLLIWHAHFGVSGSNNDINLLNTSSLFTEQCNGNFTVIKFTANGRQHHMRYYLADDIYPSWPVFLKMISFPTDLKRAFFAQRQESARKDMER
ncbi:uncharacterized protein LOC125221044 [Salvia hispanica]|uniref:uncharacterized protein LOC125221044 n=1 Tax=Salvia hispanica TaxID=49212 RepID=UPI00200931D4|nr:uncharacterized protein LOC125221044 [Salvia hispanica]